MILFLAAALTFQPVTASADVTTSNGKAYRVETCFTDPQHLRTRFIYPDRTATFVIDGDKATTQESGKPAQPSSDSEQSFGFGHNFHAIHYNFAKLLADSRRADWGWTGTLPFGGRATSLVSKDGSSQAYRFDMPDTSPIQLRFSDWRGSGIPYRLELTHAGVIYDYRFTKVEFAGCRAS